MIGLNIMKKVKVVLNHRAVRDQLLKSSKLDRKMRREHQFLRGYLFKGPILEADTRKVIKYPVKGSSGQKLSPEARARAVMRNAKSKKQRGYARYLFAEAGKSK